MMRMVSLVCAAALLAAACGGDDGADVVDAPTGDGLTASDGGADGDGAGADEGNTGGAGGFDESTLPDDFPRELIPPSYDQGSYLDATNNRTASFESGDPVTGTVDHYTGLLGDPTLVTEGEDGEVLAQWQDGPWIVSVVGGPSESLVGISSLDG